MARPPSIRGIATGKRIHRGTRAEAYRGVREDDGAEVVLKRYLSRRNLRQARREFAALRACVHPAIARPWTLDATSAPVLVMEYLEGESLRTRLSRGPMAIETALGVALQVADALVAIHTERLLHRSITPHHLLMGRVTGETHLIGFGMTCRLGAAELAGDLAHNLGTETVPYVAPEQTSRTHQGADHRCDLYMLGATLYEALTGRPPFDSPDRAELIHSHLAREPEPPARIRPDVPAVLSELVCKLLRKEPDERYQSAASLRTDLTEIASLCANGGDLDRFVLGMAETSDRPRFANHVVGREAEVEHLCASFSTAFRGEACTLAMTGPAGIGKSTLLRSLRDEVLARGGHLAYGKCDHYTSRPYDGWIQALTSLVQQHLLAKDDALERWAHELRRSLGSLSAVAVDLVPDLRAALREVEDVPKLGPRETQRRLALAVHRLLRACARPESPLVIALDDLQWADAEGRALLDALLSGEPIPALLLACAYRSDQGAATRAVERQLRSLERRGVAFDRLTVGPISPSAAAEMYAEALHCESHDAAPLAAEATARTGGNPLLLRQFVTHLHEEALLHFEGGRWTWDIDRVRASSIPDGAVGLLTAEIERLPPDVRAVLEFASCMGDQVDAPMLARLGCKTAEIEAALHALCDAGLLVPCPGGLRFAHDRVRECAQAQLAGEVRAHLHHETGWWLFSKSSIDDDDALFEIVDHLNRGRDYADEEQRICLIRLNLRAGGRALSAGTAAHADRMLRCACELFRSDDWRDERELGFELHSAAAESALLVGDVERALAIWDLLGTRAQTRLESAAIACGRIRARALREGPDEVSRYALAELRRLGVRWPLHPTTWRTRWALVRLRRWLRSRRSREDTGELPRTTPAIPDRLAAVVMITKVSGAVRARSDYHSIVLSTCFVLREALRRGSSELAAYLFAAYAAQVRMYLADGDDADAFTRLAEDWVERCPDPVLAGRARFLICTQSRFWTIARREACALLPPLVERFRETGDTEFAFYTRFTAELYRALAGDPLRERIEQMREIAAQIERADFRYPSAKEGLRALELLDRPATESDVDAALATTRASLAGADISTRIYAYTLWLMVLSIRGRDALAFALSEDLEWELWRSVPGPYLADHLFYRGLAAGRLALRSRAMVRQRCRRALASVLRHLRGWTRSGSDFAHMETLLLAERARIERDPSAADRLYVEAARAARAHGFPHHTALAHQRRADLLRDAERDDEARRARAEAIARYEEWGVHEAACTGLR